MGFLIAVAVFTVVIVIGATLGRRRRGEGYDRDGRNRGGWWAGGGAGTSCGSGASCGGGSSCGGGGGGGGGGCGGGGA